MVTWWVSEWGPSRLHLRKILSKNVCSCTYDYFCKKIQRCTVPMINGSLCLKTCASLHPIKALRSKAVLNLWEIENWSNIHLKTVPAQVDFTSPIRYCAPFKIQIYFELILKPVIAIFSMEWTSACRCSEHSSKVLHASESVHASTVSEMIVSFGHAGAIHLSRFMKKVNLF